MNTPTLPELPVVYVPDAPVRSLDAQETQLYKAGTFPIPAEPNAPDLADAPPKLDTMLPEPDFMTESDVWAMEDDAAPAPVEKVFCLRGKPTKFLFRTDLTTDADKYLTFITSMAAERDKDTKEIKPLIVPLPGHGKLVLTDPVYIGTLKLLAQSVLNPKMSMEAWGILGRKIGAKGKEPGWHGIIDIGDAAADLNRLTALAQAKEQKKAGEDTAANDSPTD